MVFPSARAITFLSVTIDIPKRDKHVRTHVARMHPGLGCLALMCSATIVAVKTYCMDAGAKLDPYGCKLTRNAD